MNRQFEAAMKRIETGRKAADGRPAPIRDRITKRLDALERKLRKRFGVPAGSEMGPGQLLAELTSDAESLRETSALRAEQKARAEWMDPEYWCCVVFESRAQKLAVLEALGLSIHEDKYISGTDLIRALKLPVPEIERPRHRMKANKKWADP